MKVKVPKIQFSRLDKCTDNGKIGGLVGKGKGPYILSIETYSSCYKN
jgi:hypothetical protein